MIEPSFRAPLMAAVGVAALFPAGSVAASRAAIALAAVAMPADPEHRVTFPAAANPLSENRFAMDRHPRPRAGLDNGNQSWQGKTIHSWRPAFGLPTGTPPLTTAGSHVPSRLRGTTLHHRRAARMIDGRRAPAARMMLLGFRQRFRKLRFQMIDDTNPALRTHCLIKKPEHMPSGAARRTI
jgi:hypothetical protein